LLKSIVLGASAMATFATGVAQAASSHAQQMLSLTPETRIEQRCNARAMGIVSREHKDFRADEFVAYAFADTVLKGDTIKAPGGALRSRGNWYRVSYSCQTSPDGLEIKAFSYLLGPVVARADWAAHFLVP
jgi:hypothetical protein